MTVEPMTNAEIAAILKDETRLLQFQRLCWQHRDQIIAAMGEKG